MKFKRVVCLKSSSVHLKPVSGLFLLSVWFLCTLKVVGRVSRLRVYFVVSCVWFISQILNNSSGVATWLTKYGRPFGRQATIFLLVGLMLGLLSYETPESAQRYYVFFMT